MKALSARRTVSGLALLPVALFAQVTREVAPVHPWPAPLYWQPTESETRAATNWAAAQPDAAGITPQAQSPANSLVFVAITPCRIVDTRAGQGFSGSFGPPSLTGGASRTFPIQSSSTCTIPSIAQAYSFNVTVVPPGFLGFITVYPTGATRPNASTLDDSAGLILANAAIVAAGTSGSVDVFANNPTDLIIDINGYYAPQTGITLAQGTAAAPSLSFSGDALTGIFSSGAGMLNLATGGLNALTVRPDLDLDLSGNLRKGGTLFLHNLGTNNLGVGLRALSVNTGAMNTATGAFALQFNTVGLSNTANGEYALNTNTTGSYNTATGISALSSNSFGGFNTATGANALELNSTGSYNTATGYFALWSNSGDFNTANGSFALQSNTSGEGNTAIGEYSLAKNISGNFNTAVGSSALASITLGATGNTATGANALVLHGGSFNTAYGYSALNFAIGDGFIANGDYNIALGANAGTNILGDNNIDIGNPGLGIDGRTPNNGAIRIGTIGTHTSFIAAGIHGVSTSAAAIPVLVDANGQLGTTSSSRRYKEDIQDMSVASTSLLRLRPVTFRYKQPYADGSKPIDYGLIAEEVAEVYPDLVVKNKDGQIETVQYQKLTPMLLNEVQKQSREIEALKAKLAGMSELEARLAALEAMLSSKATATSSQQP